VISEIRVDRQDVFDPANPDENNTLGHWGNRLHWTTREKVVRNALLFHVGEKVNQRRIHETERYLRTMVFLKDARIDPEPLPDGTVRARVWVRDSWTLLGSINYKLLGGQQTRGVGIQEQNLLGTGRTLNLNWKQDPVRILEGHPASGHRGPPGP
jgi:outer membrane protein assembly factor BamA